MSNFEKIIESVSISVRICINKIKEEDMEKINFDEYPVIGPVNRFIDLLAAIAARANNISEGESNGK